VVLDRVATVSTNHVRRLVWKTGVEDWCACWWFDAGRWRRSSLTKDERHCSKRCVVSKIDEGLKSLIVSQRYLRERLA